MKKKSTGLMPPELDKLIRKKKVNSPANGIFREFKECKTKINSGMTEDEILTIQLVNSRLRNQASMKGEYDNSIKRALKIADEILKINRLPTDIPRVSFVYPTIWELEFDEYLKTLNEEEQAIIKNGDQKLIFAFELKCAANAADLFEIVTAANLQHHAADRGHNAFKSIRDGWVRGGMEKALRIGQLLALLEMNAEYGPSIDGKRKSENARKQSMWTDSQRDKIVRTYNKLRSACNSDHDGYEKTAEALKDMKSNRKQKGKHQNLSWNMVRNVVKPGVPKKIDTR